MKFKPTRVPGVLVVELDRHEDERGFFARSFCEREFREHGLADRFVQANVSYNRRRNTLRGLHYQAEPKPEPKLVRCTRGRIFDVAVDLRADSPSYCGWVGVELSEANRAGLYVPPGCAHGFLTLEDGSEVLYLMGAEYDPALARGVRWDDPAFSVVWPASPEVISARDAAYLDLRQ